MISSADLRAIADEYPPELCDPDVAAVPDLVLFNRDLYVRRVHFDLALLDGRLDEGDAIADIGGGFGLFAMAAAESGYRPVNVDDYYILDHSPYGAKVYEMLERHGVALLKRDVLEESVGFEPGSFGAIGSFHTFEHFHRSPKRLCHEIVAALRPGGWFILAVPNAVNARKRLTVPLGMTNWTTMQSWYETDPFRGHVREPVVADLVYMARDMGLVNVEIHGRNFIGERSAKGWIRFATRLSDRLLRLRPSLCGDIYLVAQKPSSAVGPS